MRLPRTTNTAAREIVLFGLALGGLLGVLQLMEVRFLVVDRQVGLYSMGLAVIFVGVGIWLGLSWRAHTVAPAKARTRRNTGG